MGNYFLFKKFVLKMNLLFNYGLFEDCYLLLLLDVFMPLISTEGILLCEFYYAIFYDDRLS